jgi:hypothetical protein
MNVDMGLGEQVGEQREKRKGGIFGVVSSRVPAGGLIVVRLCGGVHLLGQRSEPLLAQWILAAAVNSAWTGEFQC